MSLNDFKVCVFANTEIEFWKNEFSFEVILKEGNYIERLSSVISQGRCPIVQVYSIREIQELSGVFPDKSLILHLNSDEVLDPKLNLCALRLKSTRAILRSYPTNIQIMNFSFLDFTSSIFNSILLSSWSSAFQNIKLWCHGLILTKRKIQISLYHKIFMKKVINVHLGYTDFFYANFLDRFGGERDESVFKISNDVLKEKKVFKMSFVGQKGNSFRNEMAKSIEKFDNTYSKLREKFGGTLGINGTTKQMGHDYVEAMSKSLLALCPPGNYSGITFRYAEALACGAIPVEFFHPPTDPFFSRKLSYSIKVPFKFRLAPRIKAAQETLISEHKKIFRTELHSFLDDLQIARRKILDAVE